jgi:hypothetical protein
VCSYFNPAIENLKTPTSKRRKLVLPAVSIENEIAMLTKLKYIAEKCLNKYPDTYETDMELLKQKDLSFNKRNAIIFRSGEKKVFH